MSFLGDFRPFHIKGNGINIEITKLGTFERRGGAVPLACRWCPLHVAPRCLDLLKSYGIIPSTIDSVNKLQLLYSAFWYHFFRFGG